MPALASHLSSSHKDAAVPQFRFVLETVAVAICPWGLKHYHIYHDIPPSSSGHLFVTGAQKLPHSSSLSFTLILSPSLSFFYLLCIKKDPELWFSAPFSAHVVGSRRERERGYGNHGLPSWGGRRHEIWL